MSAVRKLLFQRAIHVLETEVVGKIDIIFVMSVMILLLNIDQELCLYAFFFLLIISLSHPPTWGENVLFKRDLFKVFKVQNDFLVQLTKNVITKTRSFVRWEME